MIQIISMWVADIDNTLTQFEFFPDGNHQEIEVLKPGPVTCRALEQMHKEGILCCLASGRPLWQELSDHYQAWGLSFQFDVIIGLNGAVVWDTKKNTQKKYHELQPESLKKIIKSMDRFHLNPFLYREGYELCAHPDPMMEEALKRHGTKIEYSGNEEALWQIPTAKLLYRCETEEQGQEVMDYGLSIANEEFTCFRTNPLLVEFQSPLCTKGSALEAYCKDNNIDIQNVIAFGDAENDVEMLKKAGWGVCVSNGMQACKDAANDITEHQAGDDGVGHYLYDHHLI